MSLIPQETPGPQNKYSFEQSQESSEWQKHSLFHHASPEYVGKGTEDYSQLELFLPTNFKRNW